ncbi:MAG: hypothetical protein ABI877_16770, partial [Gemmatimonadaceae bacterium]
DVIRSLVTGAGQLERLTGGHRGFPGSSLSGLPAWSDDPSARVVQAGWLEGGERYGMALRGKWRASRDSLESQADEAWLVLFAFDPRRGTVRRLEIQRDKTRAFVSAYLVNGVPAPYDRRARDWSIAAFRLLQLMKPRDVDF